MRIFRALAALTLLAGMGLSACGTQEAAPVTYRGSSPDRSAPPVAAAPAPGVDAGALEPVAPRAAAPSGGGIVDYGGYKAVVAQPGDSLASMAGRAGISATELGSYNGIPSGWSPRAGDELILPPGAGQGAALAPALSPAAPAATQVAAAPRPAAPAGSLLDLDRLERDLASPAATPTAGGPLASAPAQRPSAIPARRVATAAPTPAPAAPRAAPAPRATPRSSVPRRDAASSSARFAAPVEGEITRGFRAGGGDNDGVDFAAPAGAPVRAAADGEVALISQSLGGLGTIVLVRHQGELLTVYGRVDKVGVKQGDRVSRGQRIGAVAPGASGRNPSLHFEVRRGAEAVDPANYL